MKFYQAIFMYSLLGVLMFSCSQNKNPNEFISDFPTEASRVWIGPEYWANPMQDWKLENGKMLCTVLGKNRNVHLLTHKIGNSTASFTMSVELGILCKTKSDADWVGFKIGAKGEFDDYRSDAVFGEGINAGVTTSGKLFLDALEVENQGKSGDALDVLNAFGLRLSGQKTGNEYIVKLELLDRDDDLVSKIEKILSADKLVGDVAVVSSFDPGVTGANAVKLENSAWFRDWRLDGEKLDIHKEYAFGPILFAQHTLSKKVLKLTAQLPPVGDADGNEVLLELKNSTGWQQISQSAIDKDARTATFRVENWIDSLDHSYRIAYKYTGAGNELIDTYFEGTIRKNPIDKREIIVAGFTGNNDLGFPNQDLVANVLKHNPDVVFFSGDQIYEPVGGFGNIHEPLDKAMIDYLRKWIMYGWEYRELLRNIPTVSIPDDHDVYHGNLWGEGGKKAKETGGDKERQDSGGYKLPADFVKMVERTQTSNLPDPYDPTPVKQGIGVYYTEMNYGGLSFAIIEDRKFKSSPSNMLPKESNIINGWAENKDFNPRHQSDVPGAVLLGERQEAFLKDWGSNWSADTDMKVLLSQTIFNNVATLPREAVSDVVVSTLRILEKGEYPPDDVIVSDMDSNGWPHTARNRAVDLLRKCFAFHIAGDQHLGSTIHYGIDDWRDAGVAVCVPSISNYFPRRWYPSTVDKEDGAVSTHITGNFFDGFNNYLTVYAVSNPVFTGKKPSKLYDRAAGFGIVKFDKKTRNINIALWPRDGDPTNPDSKPYDGWPIKINQMDNYGKKAYGYMPPIHVNGLEKPPVVKVIDEKGNEVYTVRAISNEVEIKVFDQGDYKIIIGEPARNQVKVLEGIYPTNQPQEPIEVDFGNVAIQ